MKIILFDVDRTLVHDGYAGKIAFEQAFRELFGVDHQFRIMAGKTDSSILLEAIKEKNIPEDRSGIDGFKDLYHRLLAGHINRDLPGKRIFAGVGPLLEELAGNKETRLGILTGNWKKAAYIKLSHFGLDKHFGFGAFGDDAVARNDLYSFAVNRCGSISDLDPRDVVIIGDTPSDMQCALVNSCRSLGVATGRFSAQDLILYGADHAVDDLTDTRGIADWILGDAGY